MFDGLLRFFQSPSECVARRSRDHWKKEIRLFA